MFGYRVPPPDDAMLISGGRHKGNVPFRVVVGHGAFVMPGFRKARLLTLSMLEAEVQEQCTTKQGINLMVKAVIAFKVGGDEESIVSAGQRFVADQDQMPILTGRIFAGHLRSIVGGMTVEEIITQRQKLATEVLDASKLEMAKLGLVVDSLQIQSIDDMRSGYIDAMARPQRAAVEQAAKIAEANATQAASIAAAQAAQATAQVEQESKRNQADYEQQTAVAQAGYRAKVDQAQAEAAQAGPLTQAQAQQAVLEAQATLAQKQAELRERQLVSEVIKPAEADAKRVTIAAEAAATQQRLQAEAAASSNRISLDQLLIEQLPDMIAAAGRSLAGANLTIFDGTEGVGRAATELASQAMGIFNAVRGSLPGSNGSSPALDSQPARQAR